MAWHVCEEPHTGHYWAWRFTLQEPTLASQLQTDSRAPHPIGS